MRYDNFRWTKYMIVLLILVACQSGTEVEGDQLWTIEVSGEQFTIRVAEDSVNSQLDQRMRDGTVGVISGSLVAGDGGFNEAWSWHLDPTTVHAPDFAIELCDGRPSMVEADLTYWLESVSAFCPWGALVVSRGG